jgi:phosphopantetheinyl transferase
VEPALEPRAEYNISHDGQYVLFGITSGKRIGVDIMAIPSTPDEVEEALSDHVSSPSHTLSLFRLGVGVDLIYR